MTRDDSVQAAADRLWKAHSDRTPCGNLRDLFDGTDVAAGYAIQEVNSARWEEAGRRAVGRKIGLTSRAIQTQLGVDQPDYGVLWADTCYSDAEPIPFEKMMHPKAEGEIAFVLDQDLDGQHLVLPDLIGAIAYALPAIEIADSRVKDWDISILDTVADNASAGVFILGSQPTMLWDFDPRLCGMVLERRGDPVSTGAGAACLGNPLTAALWLARKMVQVGQPLRAGEIILSGALGPMVDVKPGDALELRISGLGSVRADIGGVA
ncbi:MAG: 2-keto-4-pentenoate hydratase [Myxococcota bacterium]